MQIKDGTLQLDVGVNDFHPLNQFAPAHFRVADVPWGNDVDLHFIAADAGRPRSFEQSFGNDKPEQYESVVILAPTAAELATYAGAYVSEEIDPIYRIEVRDGKLTLVRLKQKPDTLRPATQDVFVGEIGTIRPSRVTPTSASQASSSTLAAFGISSSR